MPTDRRNDLGRGINRKASKTKIPQGYCEDIVNMRPHNSGKLTTREGTRSHAGVLPTGSAEPVRGLATYRSQAEEFPIAVADGKVFYRSAGTANTTVLMKANKTSAFSVGPAFHADTVNVSTVKRTGGAVTGNNVWGNRARITSATYNASLSQATYTILIEGYAFVAGAAAIGDVIKTTGGTKADWVTISQMSYSEYDGTFEVVSVSQSISGSDLTVTIVASNANGDSTTPADSASGGFCEILTNVISVATNSGLAAGDVITGIYNNTNTTLYATNSEVSLKGLSGTTFVIQFTEDEYIAGTNLDLRGQRTASVVPVVATTGMAVDNVLQVGSYNRHFQITAINSLNVTINDTITLSHGDAVTEPYTWSQADVPGGSGDLVPASPTRIFAADPDARVRTASIQDSVYMTNGVDPVVKFDGTNIMRAGLASVDLVSSMSVDQSLPGMSLEFIPVSAISEDPDVSSGVLQERSITLPNDYSIQVGSYVVDRRSGQRYLVTGYDSSSNKVSLGNPEVPIGPLTFTFTSSNIDTVYETLYGKYHGLFGGEKVQFDLVTDPEWGLTEGRDYYATPISETKTLFLDSTTGVAVNFAGTNGDTLTLITQDQGLYIPKRYSYYYRIKAIDVNNNIISSRVFGYGRSIINVDMPGTVVHKLVGMPAYGHINYDRLEIDLFRTHDLNADPTALTHYRVLSTTMTMDGDTPYITLLDAVPDAALSELDDVSTAIKGADLPTELDGPPISKYIAAASNRLILGNIKSNDTISLTVSRNTSASPDKVTACGGTTIEVEDTTSSQSVTFDFLEYKDETYYFSTSSGVTFSSSSGLLVTFPSNNRGFAVNNPIRFKAGSGATLPSNLSESVTYYIKDFPTSGTAHISLSPGGTTITYSDAGSGTIYAVGGRLSGMANTDQSITRAFVYPGRYVSFGNSGGSLIISDSYPVGVGNEVRFHKVDGSFTTGDFPVEITPDTTYYVKTVTSGTSYTISTTPGGTAVAWVSSTASNKAFSEYIDCLVVETVTAMPRTTPTVGNWVQLEWYAYNNDIMTFYPYGSTASSYDTGEESANNSQRTYTPTGGLTRFCGWFKISGVYVPSPSSQSAYLRVEYRHGLSASPLQRPIVAYSSLSTYNFSPAYNALSRTYIGYAAVASSADTIPIMCTSSELISSRLYRDGTFSAGYGDVAEAMQDMAEAFNSYQRSLASPWALATVSGKTINIVASDAEGTLGITVTPQAVPRIDTYINSVKGLTGSGSTRVYPSRLLRSYENFPEMFDAPFASSSLASDAIIDINTADGQEISGIGTFFADSFSPGSGGSAKEDVVVVAKTASVYAVNIKSREYQKLESHGKGCTAPDSMAATPTGIMFANNYGVYRVRPDLAVDYPGEAIEELWKTVNKDYLHLATATVDPHDRLYKIAVPTGTSTVNNEIFCYDYSREGQDQPYGAWFRTTLEGATCWATTVNDTLMGTEDGDIVQIRRDADDDGGDYQEADGSAIEAEIVLATEDFGDAGLKKRVRRFQVDVDLDESDVTGISVQQAVNTEDQWRDCGDADLTRSNTSSMAHQQEPTISWTPPVRACYRTQFKITHGVAKEKLTISGIGYKVDGISDRGARENVDPNAGSN